MTVFQDATLGVSSQNGRAVMSVDVYLCRNSDLARIESFSLIVQWKWNTKFVKPHCVCVCVYAVF